MSAPRLAWALFGLWVALTVVATVLIAPQGDYFEIVFALALTVFAAVGAVIASRRPENPIGWILEAIAIVFALTTAVMAYTATSDDPALVAMWLDDWIGDVWIALVCVWIPLLFPDGRLPSRRWRPVAWFGTAAFALGVLGRALGERTLDTEAPGTVANPYALPGVAGEVAADVASFGWVLYLLAALGALAGLVVRMRRSRGVERQQLKWFAFVGSLMLVALLLAAVSLIDEERFAANVGAVGWGAFLLLVTFGLPLAMGAAILRHRLYDIDVVINRTLVYGALTITLGAAYLGLVLLLGLTVGESDVAIAGSTLAVAALFRPARARIQSAVDRRFYRSRYDAAQTLEAFSTRLRDELDLDALRGEIRSVVGETVQPAHVSLWLKDGRK
jgi:hypothetical protein